MSAFECLTAPLISLDKSTIVCLFGPASATTSSLVLQHYRIGGKKVLLRANVYEKPLPTTGTTARDLPTSPAYLCLDFRMVDQQLDLLGHLIGPSGNQYISIWNRL